MCTENMIYEDLGIESSSIEMLNAFNWRETIEKLPRLSWHKHAMIDRATGNNAGAKPALEAKQTCKLDDRVDENYICKMGCIVAILF